MRKDNFVNDVYPWVIGIGLIILSIIFNINPSIKGYSSILESIIQFSGLIIGFYTAMYGLVLVSGNSQLFIKFRENGVENIFKNNLIQSLTISFISYTVSVIMQGLMYYTNTIKLCSVDFKISNLGYYIWIFVVGVFLGMSYRTIRLLLKMLFIQFEGDSRLVSTSNGETKEQRMKRLNSLRDK